MFDRNDDQPIPATAVFEYATEQVEADAGKLWPGAPVRFGEHVPSITNFVQRIVVGERRLYAKYSVLGEPLVSVLRGMHGAWDRVLARQREYVRRPNNLLLRQANQLYRFGELNLLPMSGFAGYRHGVLFTDPIMAGTALDELLLPEAHRTTTLLRRIWAPLTGVHTASVHGWTMLVERSITGTFNRTFPATVQRTAVPLGQLRRDVDPEVVTGLNFVVRHLRELKMKPPATALVFGQLEPEHVVLTGADPLYLNPGVHVGPPVSDLAKLMSRLLLMVICRASTNDIRRDIMGGLTALLDEGKSWIRTEESAAWMGHLFGLLARDAASAVATYLSAPSRFPLPISAVAVVDHADVVVWVVEHLVTWLVQRVAPTELWERLTADVVETAVGTRTKGAPTRAAGDTQLAATAMLWPARLPRTGLDADG
jgi:hypothetical protein